MKWMRLFLPGAGRFVARCVLAALFWVISSGELRAETREYQIKAAFLINFIQFVTWPTNAFPSDEAPFRIGILGADPFGPALDRAAQTIQARHRRIEVFHCRKVDECKDCQMVFVSKSEEKSQLQILSALSAMPVLKVSEQREFAQHGGDINFYLEDNKVRFEINPASAHREKLKISSQLLSLGKLVGPPGGPIR